MPSALNALPTVTATALGVPTGANPAGGLLKGPMAVVGYANLMDSVNFYVENLDWGTMLNVTATATSTQNGATQIHTVQKGSNVFIAVSSVNATCTIGINFQSADPTQGNFYTFNRISLDGQTGSSNSLFQIYPGIAAAAFTVGGIGATSQHTGRAWRVQASITATASGGGANVTLGVFQTRLY